MLGLDPSDELGASDYLALWLIEADRVEEAAAINEDYYEEGSAFSAYTGTLMLLMTPTIRDERAKELSVRKATETNPLVADYLLEGVPDEDLMGVAGSEESDEEAEAASYVYAAGVVWHRHPAALARLEAARRWGGSLSNTPSGAPARLFCYREPEDEDPPLAAYKSALEALIHARAMELGLPTEHRRMGPGYLYFSVLGPPQRIAELALMLLEEDDVGGFIVLVETEADREPFEALDIEVSVRSDSPPGSNGAR